MRYLQFILLISILCGLPVEAQDFGFKGQLPLWKTANPEDPFQLQAGARYIPTLSYKKSYDDKYTFDGEFSVNTYISALYSNDSIDTDEKLKPYRFWLRYSTEQFEIRAGLQKINFGSANMLRPLMWFDQIDPRDPLRLTDGVYGILGRYYFMNNANIWLWGLIGNDKLKGWESMPSVKNKPEVGGRVQVPFFTGEVAATYHHRIGNVKGSMFESYTTKNEFQENRYALDLRMDQFVGFWIEGTVSSQNHEIPDMRYSKVLNLGMDYTFSIGNGLGLLAEYIVFDVSDKITESGSGISFLTTSLSYSINIISNISAMVYYDFTNENLYRFLNASFTYDKWSFYTIGFWNPDKFQIYSNLGENNLYAGWGFQFMAVFNH